jgi:RNA polymerase sigma-70 factor (ECF subfamily)
VHDPRPDSEETVRLLERAAAGDESALNELLARHREAIRAFIAVRLDPGIRARVDPSDVTQNTLDEATRRFADYLRRRPMPFQLWIRKMAREQAIKARKKHRAECRDVDREQKQPDDSSFALVDSIVSSGPSPSEDAQARELAERVAKAVAKLAERDREILTLRQIDDLMHKEIALLLDITEDNAKQRYGRALIKLHQNLKAFGATGGAPDD